MTEHLRRYIDELCANEGQLQSPSDIIHRLEGCLSDSGPRLPPFTWTEAQVAALKVGDLVEVHWGYYPPHSVKVCRIGSIERLERSQTTLYHFFDVNGSLKIGFTRLQNMDPLSHVPL